MTDTIYAKDLHAGDWVVCPEGQGAYCWVGTRRRVGDTMHFVIGRGPGHVHRDVEMSATEKVELWSRWPEMPAGIKQGAAS